MQFMAWPRYGDGAWSEPRPVLAYRALSLFIAGLALALWWARSLNDPSVDPLWVRLILVGAWIGYAAATVWLEPVREQPGRWIVLPGLVTTVFLAVGVADVQFAWRSLPIAVVILVVSCLTITDRLAVVVAVATYFIGIGAAAVLVPATEASLPYYFALLAGVAVVAMLHTESRIRSEHRLRSNDETLRQVHAMARTGTWRSLDGWVRLSEALAEMLLLDSQVLPLEELLESIAEDDRGRLMEALDGALHGRKRFDLEVQIIEGRHWLRVVGGPVDNGPRGALAGMCQDITRIKRAEAGLIAARDAARDAMEARTHFLANISHEIRTPMNGVIGMTQLLAETDLTPQQRDYVGTIRLSSESLMTLIDDVLDFAKIDAGRIDLELRPFEVEEWALGCLQMLANAAQAKGIELVLYIDPGLPRVLVGDSLRLRQVLVNLLSNAVKFTERGEVVVEVTGSCIGATDVQLLVEVSDTGIGISKERLDALFEPFTQADTSTTRRFGGTGLGLSISRQLLELMGGEISASSAPGEGSRFEFRCTLPVPETAAEAYPHLAGMRVLAVEHNAAARLALERTLTGLGASLTVTDSAGAFLREAEAGAHDRLLIDLDVSGADGVEIAVRVRANRSRHIPSILMHGRAIDVDERLFDATLPKPFGVGALCKVLLAAEDANAAASPARCVAEASGGPDRRSGPRVLLVEDNAVNQLVARRMLEGLGAAVSIANDGAECLERLRREPVDLVLMDVQMPVMDGLQATAAIRSDPTLAGLPVIAMTANAFAEDRQRCLDAGMDDYLSKPISRPVLAQALARFVGRKLAMGQTVEPAAGQRDRVHEGREKGRNSAGYRLP